MTMNNAGMCLRARATAASSVIVKDVLIANQDGHRRAADELQIGRFRETKRVSCSISTRRWSATISSIASATTAGLSEMHSDSFYLSSPERKRPAWASSV
jgi:hypothetical protein